jgi:uncharacterized Zn finger protein (UPF0148 family)
LKGYETVCPNCGNNPNEIELTASKTQSQQKKSQTRPEIPKKPKSKILSKIRASRTAPQLQDDDDEGLFDIDRVPELDSLEVEIEGGRSKGVDMGEWMTQKPE